MGREETGNVFNHLSNVFLAIASTAFILKLYSYLMHYPPSLWLRNICPKSKLFSECFDN